MSVRVRFAPSPTGALHIGGLRTALYNYLLAKKNNGKFILRIEDTDQNRKVDQAEAYITEALSWCGLEPDESPSKPGSFGPYRQSERKQVYQKYIQELIEKGKVYYAFDTPEELSKIREVYELEKKTFKYGIDTRMSLKNSLSLSSGETEEALNTLPYVVRLKVDSGKNIKVKDGVRGYIEVKSEEIDDKILMKADGMPTYHFANVVDDHLMEITDVIRGEEWLPSLALHQLIYDAFEWNAPKFMHLPLILKPQGKGKLSKRDGEKMGFPVFPLKWENEEGFKE
ncbi:glutamate--tRNA ligase, partial [Flavobacteriaceae bacterium]|nr:glutamate--tRNA ligase [Flavobacteriaceae bacterium]